MNITFEEYKKKLTAILKFNANLVSKVDFMAFESMCEEIEAIEASHPEFVEMLSKPAASTMTII